MKLVKLISHHKDGNKRNNHVDNLEWVSDSENIQHFYKTNRLRRVPLLCVSPEKEELHFSSTAEASRYFGIDSTTMWGYSLQGKMWGFTIHRLNEGKVPKEIPKESVDESQSISNELRLHPRY
jgi:hypothetical protein